MTSMGWKDVLRPIRDGLRDNIPSHRPSDTDKDKQKRTKELRENALKGFASFDTFEEIKLWCPGVVDTLQRANTPLLLRPLPSVASDASDGPKARLVLIHDSAGNYHDYESCQGVRVERASYSCEYMQSVDTFVYFSHKLVCIPPPTWTNSLHRNGVRSLGTFLVEPQTLGIAAIMERTNATQPDQVPEYVVARKLVQMASTYGFDGWLLNIEKTFPLSVWNCARLEGFISQLSQELGPANVIWYDALTVGNTLKYQNGLTTSNLAFAKAAGSLLTNYAWTPKKVQAAEELAIQHGMEPRNIIFGIDAWAQNVRNGELPRKTWPDHGGGGTGCGRAVWKLARRGLSAGIFGPAWPYEHFQAPGSAKAVERSMWTGSPLPHDLDCDCSPAPDHGQWYSDFPILSSAEEYPAGSATFFHTDFEQAFSECSTESGIDAHIGSQSIVPRPECCRRPNAQPSEDGVITRQILARPCRLRLGFRAMPSLPLVAVSSIQRFADYERTAHFQLCQLEMPCTGSLQASLTYSKPEIKLEVEISVVLDLETPTFPKYDGLTDSDLEAAGVPADGIPVLAEKRYCLPFWAQVETTKCINLPDQPKTVLKGIRVEVKWLFSYFRTEDIPVMFEILRLSVQRRPEVELSYSIVDLQLERREKDCSPHHRLLWSFAAGAGSPLASCAHGPVSAITGPFSHFSITIAGLLIGKAYALEFVLSKDLVQRLLDEDNVTVAIEGYGFDGTLICQQSCTSMDIRRGEEQDWHFVDGCED